MTFACDDDICILHQTEEAGYWLPYSCRAGSCPSCAGKLVTGSLDQSDKCFLDDDQIEDERVFTWAAHPTYDVTIVTHKEEELTV